MSFLRNKCRNYGKIRIFGKWPPGSFYGPLWSLTSCKKSEKSNGAFQRKVRKTQFWSFWVRFGHIWARMGRTGIFQNMAFETENDVMDINLHAKNKKNSMDGF